MSDPEGIQPPSEPAGKGRVCGAWLLIALFLVVFGAKMWLMENHSISLPYYDQWDSEAQGQYIPYYEGRLKLADWFYPQNEHTIILTRLLLHGLLLWNGQWDAKLQMVANNLIHALTAVGFAWLCGRFLGRRFLGLSCIPIALTFALPFGWENTLAGMQSQYYLLLALSLMSIWLVGFYPESSKPWWAGVAILFASLFTLVAGLLTGAAIITLMGLRIVTRRVHWRTCAATIVICGVQVVTGLMMKVKVPIHDHLQATNLRDFLVSLGNNLAWPWIVIPPVAILNFLPTALLAFHYLRAREKNQRAEEFVFGVTFWVLLQALGTAFGRGAGGAMPMWRYMDSLSFITITNALSLMLLGSRYIDWRRPKWLWVPFYAGWISMVGLGLYLLNLRAWEIDIPERQFLHEAFVRNTRAYMATDDVTKLTDRPPAQLPYPYGKRFAELLHDPSIRPILPSSVRPPLAITPQSIANECFVTNGFTLNRHEPATERSWGSYNVNGVLAKGSFESKPLPKSKFSYLEIPLAGQIGEEGLSLQIVDLTSQKTTEIKPSKSPGRQWQNYYVRAPAGEFKIVAKDESDTKWFAFKEPREIGGPARWSMAIIDAGQAMFWLGTGLSVVGAVAGVRRCLKSRAAPSA